MTRAEAIATLQAIVDETQSARAALSPRAPEAKVEAARAIRADERAACLRVIASHDMEPEGARCPECLALAGVAP